MEGQDVHASEGQVTTCTPSLPFRAHRANRDSSFGGELMTAFTEAERAYLRDQPLMRFATASPTGRPDVAPVVFEVDGDDIVTSGFDIGRTVRYRNVQANPRATVVVDDLASTNPWSPRGIKVIGSATIERRGDGECFRISPEVVISWGINDTTPGIPTMERRRVKD